MKRLLLLLIIMTAVFAASAKVTDTSWKDLTKDIKNHPQRITVVDVYAVWCGPCKVYAPIFDKVAEELPQAAYYRLDIDKNEVINDYISIQAVPTTLIFYYVKGETKPRVLTRSGLLDEEELKLMLKKAIAMGAV